MNGCIFLLQFVGTISIVIPTVSEQELNVEADILIKETAKSIKIHRIGCQNTCMIYDATVLAQQLGQPGPDNL